MIFIQTCVESLKSEIQPGDGSRYTKKTFSCWHSCSHEENTNHFWKCFWSTRGRGVFQDLFWQNIGLVF